METTKTTLVIIPEGKTVNNHFVIEAIKTNLENNENLKTIMADYPTFFLASQKYLGKPIKKICEPIINQYGETNKLVEYINYNAGIKETKAAVTTTTITKPKTLTTPKVKTEKSNALPNLDVEKGVNDIMAIIEKRD